MFLHYFCGYIWYILLAFSLIFSGQSAVSLTPFKCTPKLHYFSHVHACKHLCIAFWSVFMLKVEITVFQQLAFKNELSDFLLLYKMKRIWCLNFIKVKFNIYQIIRQVRNASFLVLWNNLVALCKVSGDCWQGMCRKVSKAQPRRLKWSDLQVPN